MSLSVLLGRRALPAASGVSIVLPTVVTATRVLSAAVALGLLLVLLSVFVADTSARYLEYVSAGLFIYAWATAHSAIWRQEANWRREALTEAFKWAGQFLVFSILLGGVLQIG